MLPSIKQFLSDTAEFISRPEILDRISSACLAAAAAIIAVGAVSLAGYWSWRAMRGAGGLATQLARRATSPLRDGELMHALRLLLASDGVSVSESGEIRAGVLVVSLNAASGSVRDVKLRDASLLPILSPREKRKLARLSLAARDRVRAANRDAARQTVAWMARAALRAASTETQAFSRGA